VTVQEGVTSFDTQHHNTKQGTGACRAVSCRLSTGRASILHAPQERTANHLSAHRYSRPDSAATCLSSTPRRYTACSRSSYHPKRTTGATGEHITMQLLRNYCTTDQINNIICALL